MTTPPDRSTQTIQSQTAPVPTGLTRPPDWVDLSSLDKLAQDIRALLEFASSATEEGKTADDWAVEGRGWASLGEWRRALHAYTQAASLPGSALQRAGYRFAVGVLLFTREDYKNALDAFETALRASRRPFPLSLFTPLPLRELVAKALFNKGIALGALGRADDAVAAYDQVLARFGQAQDLPLRERVANALVNKGAALGALGRPEEEIAAYDQVEARFGQAQDLPLRVAVASALVNKGAALGALGRFDDAVAACDQALALRPDDPLAHYNKARALSLLQKGEEALTSLEQAIAADPAHKESARGDPDFAFLRDHSQHGPRFRALVGG